MDTKFNEIIKTTSVLEEMRDNYLAERLLRTWSEDFIDEDTGETVTIERNEIIFDRGTFLNSDVLSQINFHLQTEDIKEVTVSNQKRCGVIARGYTSIWSVQVKVYGKKRTYFLYANSVQLAIEIINDYLEQSIEGSFVIINIKELGYDNLIRVPEDDTRKDFYKTEVEITYEGEEPVNRIYILQAKDAEEAKESIVNFISLQLSTQDKNTPFDTTIVSAQTISCSNIIDYKFSQEYFDNILKP